MREAERLSTSARIDRLDRIFNELARRRKTQTEPVDHVRRLLDLADAPTIANIELVD